MPPLVNQFLANQGFETKVCVTGQHREMLYKVIGFFDIIPDYDLSLMKPNQIYLT
jgi:UDP-N-acetylglucosamine 2-epimerase (non-hydrolysing)